MYNDVYYMFIDIMLIVINLKVVHLSQTLHIYYICRYHIPTQYNIKYIIFL